MKGAKGNDRIAAMLAAPGMPHLGGTLGAVLFLAWPAIIEQIMLTLVQYVDTAMVGSLGSNATAAVGRRPSGFPCRWPSTWAPDGRRTPSVSLGRPCGLWGSSG